MPDTRLHHLDLALTQQAVDGDRAAASVVARRLLPVVGRVARALVAGASEAQDAQQVALLEILRDLASYAGAAPLERWARRVASRSVIRGIRKGRAQRTTALDDADVQHAAVPSTEVFDALPRPLRFYLDALPMPQREAVILRHALEHTIPEIAEICGAPVPTVKSRIQKGNDEIRRMVRRDIALGLHAGGVRSA